MSLRSRERGRYWAALALPVVVMFVFGSVSWWDKNFKGPDDGRCSPFVIPPLIGLLAGLACGWVVRVVFPNDSEPKDLHLMFSILATFALAISFCLWWGDWAVSFAW